MQKSVPQQSVSSGSRLLIERFVHRPVSNKTYAYVDAAPGDPMIAERNNGYRNLYRNYISHAGSPVCRPKMVRGFQGSHWPRLRPRQGIYLQMPVETLRIQHYVDIFGPRCVDCTVEDRNLSRSVVVEKMLAEGGALNSSGSRRSGERRAARSRLVTVGERGRGDTPGGEGTGGSTSARKIDEAFWDLIGNRKKASMKNLGAATLRREKYVKSQMILKWGYPSTAWTFI